VKGCLMAVSGVYSGKTCLAQVIPRSAISFSGSLRKSPEHASFDILRALRGAFASGA